MQLFNKDKLNISLPDEVLIVGCGLNGLKMHEFLTDDIYTIVLNGAISYIIKKDMWFMADDSCYLDNWYKNHIADDITKVFSTDLLNTSGDTADYEFEQTNPLDNNFTLIPNGIQPNGSVMCGALQMLYFSDVKKIILCGGDMTGIYKAYCGVMNNIIKQIQDKGIEIYSISETNLDIRSACV